VFDQEPMVTEHDVLNHRISPISTSPLPVPGPGHHYRDPSHLMHRASSAVDAYYGHTARQLIPATSSQQQHGRPPHSHHPRAASTAPAHQVGKIQYTDHCNVLIEDRDPNTHRVVSQYRCGALLGTGGFAKVFDVVDLHTGERFACKIIDKVKLSDAKKRMKFFAEVDIHRRLNHPNILHFYKTFQDEWYHYMILERCGKESLMELSKARGVFSTEEIQHIMAQLLQGVEYLHSKYVLHRDLKLGNIMVDAGGNMKIGDFGFATQLAAADERKHTMCGTPNYIAPEVLAARAHNTGYSFEVDTWSIGVILYTLAVGIPPFETKDLETTYQRIQACDYSFPARSSASENLRALVHSILQRRPEARLSLVAIRAHRFFRSPPCPTSPPLSLVALDADISPPASRTNSPYAHNPSSPFGYNVSPTCATPYSAPRRADENPTPHPVAPSPTMRTGNPLFPAAPFSGQGHHTLPPPAFNSASTTPGNDQQMEPNSAAAGAVSHSSSSGEEAARSSSRSSGSTDRLVEEVSPSPKCSPGAERLFSSPSRLEPILPPAPGVVITCFVSFPKYGYGFLMQTPGQSASSPLAAALLNDRTKIVYDQTIDKAWYYARVKGPSVASNAQDDDRGRSPQLDGEPIVAATGFCDERHDYSNASVTLSMGAVTVVPPGESNPTSTLHPAAALKKFTIVKFLHMYMRGLRTDVVPEENPIFRSAVDSMTVPPALFAAMGAPAALSSSRRRHDVVYVKELHLCPLSDLKFKELRTVDRVQSCTARLSDGAYQVSLMSIDSSPLMALIAPAVVFKNTPSVFPSSPMEPAAAFGGDSYLNAWTSMDLVLYGKNRSHLLVVLRHGSLTAALSAADLATQMSSDSSSRRRTLCPSYVAISGGRNATGGIASAAASNTELILPPLLTRAVSDLLLNVGLPADTVDIFR
jgi:serine/threonine protein kinase